MKLISTFMAILILVLSLLPCSDGDDHSHSHESSNITQVSTMTHSEHGQNYEHCSPLCHCSCCKTSVAVNKLNLVPSLIGMEMKPFHPIDDQFISEHIQNILQPPRA